MTSQTDPAATRSVPACCRPQSVARSAGLLAGPAAIWMIGSLLIVLAVPVGILSASTARDSLWVGAICFAASAISLLPLGLLLARSAAQLPVWLLASIGIRGGLTILTLIGSIAAGWIDGGAVAIPLSLWYAALLVVDLVVVARFLSNAVPISARPDSERVTC